jgi:adenosylhomocysteine nucleosidase
MKGARVAELVEQAFEYRGYVTVRRTDGTDLVGFVYDRGNSHLELFDETATRRVRVPLDDVADIVFTGEDTARKSHEIWERRKGTLEPRETPAWGDWQDLGPILLLVALDRELRSAARSFGASPRGNRAQGRFAGTDAVALAIGLGGGARRAVADERPRLVVSCGFSGGLDDELEPGDVVLATDVRDEAGDELAAPESVRRLAARALSGMRLFEGELVCTTAVATTSEEKRALARPGALAVDMESYPAARAAAEAGIPWLALRVIVDPLASSLPAFTREAHGRYLGPALKYALSGPRAVVDLTRLALRAGRAGAALERALRLLGPALAGPALAAAEVRP